MADDQPNDSHPYDSASRGTIDNKMSWKPPHLVALLVACMASWLERRAAAQIGYLRAENRALRSRLGRRRILFTATERRTLSALAKDVGLNALRELDPNVTPATLLRGHRELVAKKWTFLERRGPSRPRTTIDIEQLVVRMAHENPTWGYTRIHGALRNLNIKVGRGTIRRILKDHLIEPAPTRGQHVAWSVFLKAHWKAMAASDEHRQRHAPTKDRIGMMPVECRDSGEAFAHKAWQPY